MATETWAAGAVIERAFTYRGHDRYAHLALCVSPDEGAFGITLHDAVCDDPDWAIYRQGVIDGLRGAACALGLCWACVRITEVRVHPVDSGSAAFAMAAARCLNAIAAELARVPREIPPGALARVTTARREVSVAGLRVEAQPLARDAPITWTARWRDIDPDAQTWMNELMRELCEMPAPWVDVQVHTGDALGRGHGYSRASLRSALHEALAAAGPLERDAVLPPVTLIL